MSDHTAVRDYYDQFGAREWERLNQPEDGQIELAINQRVINAYLPTKARVLDLGGGPGRYTFWLAGLGHRVTLADLSPALLSLARTQAATLPQQQLIEEIVETDACDLTHWPNQHFDAVLALGPFYHLPAQHDREQAAREIVRILRPGGYAFIALMPRLAFLRRLIANPAERHRLEDPDVSTQILTTGAFTNDQPGHFTQGYGVEPAAVAPFFASVGLVQERLLASQSIVPDLQGVVAGLAKSEPATYERLLTLLVDLADDPGILGLSTHLLYVGRKPN